MSQFTGWLLVQKCIPIALGRASHRFYSEIPGELSRGQIAALKRMERRIEREQMRVETLKRRNIYTGLGLFGLVMAIYSYTIFAVKQETVLTEMDIEFEEQMSAEAATAK